MLLLPLSISANNWGSCRCRCRFRLTPPMTGGAVADNWGSCCCRVHLCRCHPPSPLTTGGDIATVARLCRQLGELLLPSLLLSNSADNWGSHCRQLGEPLPLLSVSANNWGSRCCRHHHHLSPPTTGGSIVVVTAFIHLRQQLGEPSRSLSVSTND